MKERRNSLIAVLSLKEEQMKVETQCAIHKMQMQMQVATYTEVEMRMQVLGLPYLLLYRMACHI